ncbi:MAG: NAD-dependent epimerase/dehydratase family protein [Desulfosoma sp.]
MVFEGYDDFLTGPYDVLINCVGVGTRKNLKWDYSLYFTVIEEFDNLCLQYLRTRRSDALYISLSSGAVYGRHHQRPVTKASCHRLKVNKIQPEDYYGISRIYAETKHRSFASMNVVDLRVFSYFSRFANLHEEYFLSEIMGCLIHNIPFRTTPEDMVRDYIHPTDLFRLTERCIEVRRLNTAFDAVSLKPVTKMELLHFFATEYGLHYEFTSTSLSDTATGTKRVYCSAYRSSDKLGYRPSYTSLQTISEESRQLLESFQGKERRQ